MKKYTIGALFNIELTRVLMILKNKPDWQKGKFNFPGGSFESGESAAECIAREFKEETDLDIPPQDWQHIGVIINPGNYSVDFLTTVHYPKINGASKNMTDEKLKWHDVNGLPENVISNMRWLIPFAKNIWNRETDGLKFGTFEYASDKKGETVEQAGYVDLDHEAAIFLEANNIAGDTTMQMNHNIEDLDENEVGGIYISGLLSSFVNMYRAQWQQQQDKAGCHWVSGEQHSQHYIAVCCRMNDYIGHYFTARYDFSLKIYRGTDGRSYNPNEIEWLDEQMTK